MTTRRNFAPVPIPLYLLFIVVLLSAILKAQGDQELRQGIAESRFYRFYLVEMETRPEEVDKWLVRQDSLMNHFLELTGLQAPLEKIDYYVYPSFEVKALKSGKMDLSHADFEKFAVHSVVAPEVSGIDFRMDARIVLRRLFGQPRQHFLEIGLSVYFSDCWAGQKKGYEPYAIRLINSRPYPLEELLDNAFLERESWIVADLMAGSFVNHAIRQWGMDNLMRRYSDWQPWPTEPPYLQKGWDEAVLSKKVDSSATRAVSPVFQKGFCHAHEGYRIYNGYSSQKSDDALNRLQEIGVNAISITPFSYMQNPREASYLPFMRRAGTETDESVIHAGYAARQLGMQVMLKPHIWLRRSWPGDVDMPGDEEWERFFQFYFRWIRHYALLAEMMEAEYFCVGVELGKTTIGHEDRWREMVIRLRKIFSGKLVYAANWGTEFETLTFWDVFDYVGLNCYYPLSKSPEATDGELLSGAKKIAAKISEKSRQFDRPVILTEIGFTSTEAPWLNPHEVARGKTVNLQHQARCYRAMYRALHNLPELQGVYWWKWPTYLEYGGPSDPDFTPNGKPAEQVLRKWFSE